MGHDPSVGRGGSKIGTKFFRSGKTTFFKKGEIDRTMVFIGGGGLS